MKFAAAVVMLVCALIGAEASWNALQIAPGVSYVNSVAHGAGAWGGPWNGAWNGGWNGAWNGGWNGAWGAPAAVAVHAGAGAPWSLTGPGGWHGASVPGIALAQGPGLAAGHGHEGVYVAKTRGAIHTAPLAGHINSATSVNVAPAPGTL
ncbi:adult cuticle protein 1 [Drosophila guanche]|uniref:Blast:Adult cuticle protein 1 n=1 Tax=Drosophila guanche TaxID=7266 RepID=A0A3B0K223_DROGU|nr:adult cuticle protein 1 [Drosophila guanche]SPP79656.1 blast:Adult cuticle protein 1 [Drosophila guanche]